MSEEVIEKEIQEKGLTAPRLTPDMIDATIAGFDYPFLCFNGNSHKWKRTYRDVLIWTSNGTGTSATKDAPLLKEYRCFCGAIKQTY